MAMNSNDASLFYQHSRMLRSLYPQHSTKEERGDQHPSIAEKLTAELVAPQKRCIRTGVVLGINS